jgi:hypothetical protein
LSGRGRRRNNNDREQYLEHVRYLIDASAHACTDLVSFATGIVLQSSNVRRGLNDGLKRRRIDSQSREWHRTKQDDWDRTAKKKRPGRRMPDPTFVLSCA